MRTTSIGWRLPILIFAAASWLGAQSWDRSVEGVVTDQHRHPLEHAVVQIHNDWTLMVRSYVTQADGKYHFAGLSRDTDYQLRADYDGIRSPARTLNKFDSHEDRKMNLTIHLRK
jgi:hypothetical protein